MRIYLAARYSRRQEVLAYRRELRAAGHIVLSSWLDADQESGERLVPEATEFADRHRAFCEKQFFEVVNCDLLIAFTEPATAQKGSGARHIEMGIALGLGRRVWVVGHRENLFCWLPEVRFFESWNAALATLITEPENRPT